MTEAFENSRVILYYNGAISALTLFVQHADGYGIERGGTDDGTLEFGIAKQISGHAQCDALVCMPNHLHFVVVNMGESLGMDKRTGNRADLRVRPVSGAQRVIEESLAEGEPLSKGEHTGSPLPAMVQWFRTLTQLRGRPPAEMELLRRAYAYIMES